jgi:hypothetical protein
VALPPLERSGMAGVPAAPPVAALSVSDGGPESVSTQEIQ